MEIKQTDEGAIERRFKRKSNGKELDRDSIFAIFNHEILCCLLKTTYM